MQTGSRAPRRRHADELKARVLAACAEPSASVAAVAQAHGLNANLVHQWRRGCGAPTYSAARPVRTAVTAGAEFIPVALPTTTVVAPATNGQAIAMPSADIRIEWRRGAAAIAVSWPVSAAPECARWLLQCKRPATPPWRTVVRALQPCCCHRCGSSSSIRLFRCVGSRVSTSLR